MADIRITEYTDPGCPWAYSAEPFRQRLNWLYGEQLEWRLQLVGLSESAEEYEAKGFTPEFFSESNRKMSAEHGMPMDTRTQSRMSATLPACRAVVAARLHAPDKEWLLLRHLRMHYFSGGALDDSALIAAAASDAGLDPSELERWCREEAVEKTLRADMATARNPIPAATALEHKLASWSGGLRYTCPSYELTRLSDGLKFAAPGFQPFAVYEVIATNLAPGLARRPTPQSVEEVLQWADTPLATKEVAVICEISGRDAREQLGRVASERHVGADGFWTL